MDGKGVHPDRVRRLNGCEYAGGPVLYWMSRDQRAADNWALLYAQQEARKHGAMLGVVFCLVPEFLGATWRQYEFMLRGLEETERGLRKKGIGFFLVCGAPAEEIPRVCTKLGAGLLVTDFDPLRIKRQWREKAAERAEAAVCEVDAHNVVPCWAASSKQEYGAYTLRPKLHRLLPEYLEPFPKLRPQRPAWETPPVDWARARACVNADDAAGPVPGIAPGAKAAMKTLRGFIAKRLDGYAAHSNDPVHDVQSGLSPYLHFGQLAPQRAALEVWGLKGEAAAAFLEQLLVRRELADNHCWHNPHYDALEGAPAWALATLDAHRADPRPYVYTREVFEQGATHDPLWNAAQRQMTRTGKMHNYMRMYWAKKILEWSASPEEAFDTAVNLNDRYELDGRDPNGYAGIAWSIGGVHDRPWPERPVYGKVRSMTAQGCRRKFDVQAYIDATARL